MGVQAMKHAAMLQQWSVRIGECRSSGMTVKAWCAEQGIPLKTYYYWEKKFVTEASRQLSLPVPAQAGVLMRVNPESMGSRKSQPKRKPLRPRKRFRWRRTSASPSALWRSWLRTCLRILSFWTCRRSRNARQTDAI